jgi:hypothetical protein
MMATLRMGRLINCGVKTLVRSNTDNRDLHFFVNIYEQL